MDQTNPASSVNNALPRIQGILWISCGLLAMAAFFLPQFSIVNQGINGIDLVRALDRESRELMKFIGEFTTFMMYFSIAFSMFVGFWAFVGGIGRLAFGRKKSSLATVVLSIVAVLLCVFTISLLDDNPSGFEGLAFLGNKLMPEPAVGYYLAIYLHAGIALSGILFAFLSASRSKV